MQSWELMGGNLSSKSLNGSITLSQLIIMFIGELTSYEFFIHG